MTASSGPDGPGQLHASDLLTDGLPDCLTAGAVELQREMTLRSNVFVKHCREVPSRAAEARP